MTTVPTILCTPCLRTDQNVNAVKYCVECNENFCRICLRKHIKEFASVAQRHRLLNRDEMPEWLSGTASDGSGICTRHKSNQLDSYCEDHDTVCCGACVVIEHSLCENVRDLIPISGEAEPKTETDVLLQDLKFMTDALRSLKESRRKDQSNLRKSTAKSLTRVRDFRRWVNDVFDELEKQAVEDIDTECIKEDNIIESDIKQTEYSLTLLEMAINQIRDVEENTDAPLMETNLNTINGRKLLKDVKHMCQEIQEKNILQVNFKVNKNIFKYISALKNIGKCKIRSNEKPATSVKVSHYTVDVDDEKTNSDFQDVIQTESGTFLLLDAENKCIKQLDESFQMKRTYELDEPRKEARGQCTYEPFALCCITDNEIAVSMPRDKVVKLYRMGELLENVTEIDIGEHCRGLAYNGENQQMFVACGGGSYTGEGLGHVRVYNLNGELIKSFKQTHEGKIISPKPMHLAIDSENTRIHIADALKGIVTIDNDGRVLSTFTASELAESHGICVDVNDQVIVCGFSSKVILRIHGDMKAYDVLLTEENGLRSPQSLCYDATSSKCVFTTNSSNQIGVFDV